LRSATRCLGKTSALPAADSRLLVESDPLFLATRHNPLANFPHPARVLSCAKAQKHRSASPLFATLTHSLSRKSFPCHSYANTRDTVPLRHLRALCVSALSLPSISDPYKTTRVWGHACQFPSALFLARSGSVANPILSSVCGLFISLAAFFRAPVLCFQLLAGSLAKTPGVGGAGAHEQIGKNRRQCRLSRFEQYAMESG
jgi:hypothetical protein